MEGSRSPRSRKAPCVESDRQTSQRRQSETLRLPLRHQDVRLSLSDRLYATTVVYTGSEKSNDEDSLYIWLEIASEKVCLREVAAHMTEMKQLRTRQEDAVLWLSAFENAKNESITVTATGWVSCI